MQRIGSGSLCLKRFTTSFVYIMCDHEAVRLSWVIRTDNSPLFEMCQFKKRTLLCLPAFLVQLSIQRAAVWVVDQYYSDFPVYNPTMLNLPKSILSKKLSAFKVYNLGEGKMISCLQFTNNHKLPEIE